MINSVLKVGKMVPFNLKKVEKDWGHEIWLASYYNDSKYALKEIMIRKSFQSSIQFHEFKHETTYVQSGKGLLHYNEDPIDVKKFNEQMGNFF